MLFTSGHYTIILCNKTIEYVKKNTNTMKSNIHEYHNLKNNNMKKNYFIRYEKAAFKFSGLLIALLFLLSYNTSQAQLSGWMYKDGIKVTENAGTQQLNYQVLLNINTAALISANKMQAGGEDIRFSKDCAGATLLNYFIESGINTANTQIWVMLDTLKANTDYGLYMWYGNATATAASSFNNTFPLSTQMVVPAGSITLSGTNTYSWFEIQAGASVIITPNSPFVINARKIKISGTLNGNGAGYLGGATGMNGTGPGFGTAAAVITPTTTSGGGGAYGGNGGNGNRPVGTNGDGGLAYGSVSVIDMGSGGGGPVGTGAGATDGNGGAAVTLRARVVEITGVIDINGNNGTTANNVGCSGGGGAGGGLLTQAFTTTLTGTVNANGGNGGTGNAGGGGGGGGRINLYSELSITPGTYNVNYGIKGVTTNTNNPAASDGQPGVVFTGTFTANEPTYVMLPHVTLAAGNTTICQGTSASFTASTGFSPYNFYVNTASAQNTASNTFSSSTLNNNDTVRVLGTDAIGCADTSNSIIVTVNASPTVSINPASATYCAPGSAGLTASGASTYTWSPPTDLSSTSGPNVTASPSVTTQYTVAATDVNGCMDSETVTVTVNNCTGINLLQTNAFSVYPNPTNGNFVISANFSEDTRLELKNALGQTVLMIEEHTLTGPYKKEVSASTLPDGMYFLLYKTSEGSQTKKIIKN